MHNPPVVSDVTDLLTSAGVTLSANADATFALSAANALLQRRLNRSYTQVTEPRRINGSGTAMLVIPPCQDITLVEVSAEDGTILYEVTTENYVAEPWDQTTKRWIRRISGYPYQKPIWARGEGSVVISATWGEVMPDEVAQAIAMQAALTLLPGAIGLATGAIQQWETGGPEGRDSEQYRERPWAETANGWQAFVAQVLRDYRRLTL